MMRGPGGLKHPFQGRVVGRPGKSGGLPGQPVPLPGRRIPRGVEEAGGRPWNIPRPPRNVKRATLSDPVLVRLPRVPTSTAGEAGERGTINAPGYGRRAFRAMLT